MAEKQDVLMLPITAIQYKDGKSYVMPTDSTQMTEVKTGISNEEHIEIVSGLKEGDKVLLSNSALLTLVLGTIRRAMEARIRCQGGGPTNGKQNRGSDYMLSNLKIFLKSIEQEIQQSMHWTVSHW